MRDDEPTPPQAVAVPGPLAYATPRLVTYGALADITRAVGSSSNMDGGVAAGKMMSQP
ncbi:MAG: hypothetical protein ACHQQ3_13860 [Gemmatimonadales bacterium]